MDRVPDLLRIALWEAYKHQCFYTFQDLPFEKLEIDHILPRRLGNSEEELKEIKKRILLPETFDLSCLQNLAPTSRRQS